MDVVLLLFVDASSCCFAQGTLFSFHPLALLLRPALLLPTTLPTRFALQLLVEHSTEPDHDPYHPLSKRSHSILNILYLKRENQALDVDAIGKAVEKLASSLSESTSCSFFDSRAVSGAVVLSGVGGAWSIASASASATSS